MILAEMGFNDCEVDCISFNFQHATAFVHIDYRTSQSGVLMDWNLFIVVSGRFFE